MTESEYPHWREALFGNGHVANLWCAIKYFAWHGAHLLLAIFGVLLFVLVKAYRGIKKAIGYVTPDSAPSGPTIGLTEKLTSETASNVALFGFVIIAVLTLGYWFVQLILYALANTMMFLAIVGGAVIVLAVSVLGIIVLTLIEKHLGPKEKSKNAVKVTGVKTVEKAGQVKEKSKNTPLLRRIVGYCPVSMSMEPRWFNRFAKRFDDE